MFQIKKHDATMPLYERTMIVHICNNINIWSQGFVLALEAKYPQAKITYHTETQILGKVQYTHINDNLVIANMIAQDGVMTANNLEPLKWEALELCLEHVYRYAKKEAYTIQMPKIGSGLAGGNWEDIKQLIFSSLI